MSGIIQYVTFQVWLLSLSMISMLIHMVACQYLMPLYGWIILHHVDRPHFICPFVYSWTSGLLAPSGYCEQCCYEYAGASIWIPVFNSFAYSLGEIAWSYGNSVFNSLRNHQTVIHSGYTISLSPAMHKGPNFSTSLPKRIIFYLFIFLLLL